MHVANLISDDKYLTYLSERIITNFYVGKTQ